MTNPATFDGIDEHLDEITESVPSEIDLLALSRLSLFGHVNMDEFGAVLNSCSVLQLSPGEMLLQRGQSNDRMYVVLQGRLSIHLEENGDVFAILNPGETVGEMSIIGAQPTSAYVKADRQCLLLVITESALWNMVEQDVNFARNLMQLFARRLLNVTHAVYYDQQLIDKFKKQAMLDSWTGLYNRHWLAESLPYEMSRCVLRDRPLSLLLVDIDHFERFNAKHGSVAGDQVLKALANALLIGLRGLDMAVRYGSEDFLVVLPGADVNEAEKISARLHHAIEQITLFDQAGKALPNVTVSIGIAGLIENDYAEMLIARTEASLSRAKQQGGNCTSQ